MRVIKIDDKNLTEWIEEKGEIIKEGRGLTDKITKIEIERAKMGDKVQTLKDKIIPRIAKSKEVEGLDEFELLGTADVQNGIVVIQVLDAIEEFKKSYRQQKEASKNKKKRKKNV